MDILDIEGLKTESKAVKGYAMTLHATCVTDPEGCYRCGVIGHLYRHGARSTFFRDSPIRGYTVKISIPVQRWRCRSCGETFRQSIPGIDQERRMTERCIRYIQRQCLRDTFVHVANHVGCDEKTVRNIAAEHIEALNRDYRPQLPEWLGIDETKINGDMRCVLTDVANRKPVDLLQNRDQGTVLGWLDQFRGSTHIRGVAMDMWRPYKVVIQAVFPGLPIVIDKFHVVRMANFGMEKVRIRLQSKLKKGERVDWKRSKGQLRKRPHNLETQQEWNLDRWLANEPDLATAYHLKESFFEMYDFVHRRDAERHLDSWIASVPSYLKEDFKPLLTALKNWRQEILAYFESGRITNGYTECFNGIAKIANRSGRGYSFEVLRARALFGIAGIEPVKRARGEKQKLLGELGHHCQICSGIFITEELEVHLMPAILMSKVVERNLVCSECSKRFHHRDT